MSTPSQRLEWREFLFLQKRPQKEILRCVTSCLTVLFRLLTIVTVGHCCAQVPGNCHQSWGAHAHQGRIPVTIQESIICKFCHQYHYRWGTLSFTLGIISSQISPHWKSQAPSMEAVYYCGYICYAYSSCYKWHQEITWLAWQEALPVKMLDRLSQYQYCCSANGQCSQ